MASRYDKITISWTADFLDPGQKVIELTPEDQEDPRLLALIAWHKEKQQAEAEKRRAENGGDPFTLA